jgi:hypothetical protein
MRFHRILSGFVLAIPFVFAASFLACGGDEAAETDGGEAASGTGSEMSVGGTVSDPVERGKFLVTVLGCDDCHSPKKMGPHGPMPDPALRMSGHPADMVLPDHDPSLVGPRPDQWILANNNFTAYVGPWGTTYAANLTPDPTGIGGWTEDQFIKALTEGKYKGMDDTRMLMPPMPFQAYGKLPDSDLKAIFAYLQSLPPVDNAVPASMPSDMWMQMMAGGAPGGPPPEGGDDAAAPGDDNGDGDNADG